MRVHCKKSLKCNHCEKIIFILIFPVHNFTLPDSLTATNNSAMHSIPSLTKTGPTSFEKLNNPCRTLSHKFTNQFLIIFSEIFHTMICSLNKECHLKMIKAVHFFLLPASHTTKAIFLNQLPIHKITFIFSNFPVNLSSHGTWKKYWWDYSTLLLWAFTIFRGEREQNPTWHRVKGKIGADWENL